MKKLLLCALLVASTLLILGGCANGGDWRATINPVTWFEGSGKINPPVRPVCATNSPATNTVTRP